MRGIPGVSWADGIASRSIRLAVMLSAAWAAGLTLLIAANTAGWTLATTLVLFCFYLLVLLVTQQKEGFAWTPVTMFFSFAVIHAALGFYTAAPTAAYLTRPTGRIYETFEWAYFIVSLGLVSIMAGYLWAGRVVDRPAVRSLVAKLIARDVEIVSRRARILLLVALPTFVYLFWQFGEVPLLSRNPGQVRYIQFMKREFQLLTWIQNRCFDIVQVAAAWILVALPRSKQRVLDVIVSALALIAALLAVRRALLFSLIVIVGLAAFGGRRLRILFLLMPLALAAYVVSQYYILNLSITSDLDRVFDLYGQALPEVRDLAFFLSSIGDRELWGSTFLYALIPLPSFSTELQQQIMLRSVTLEAIGIPLDSAHGGLRIFLAGESYINFGSPGVVVIGFLYGIFCAAMARCFSLVGAIRRDNTVARFVLASLWVLTSFCVYLGGTGAAGVIRVQVILLVMLCYRAARYRAGPP